MAREIRLNAFSMNCVAHQSPGLWRHPRDRWSNYNCLSYWTDLAKVLGRGKSEPDNAYGGRWRPGRLRL